MERKIEHRVQGRHTKDGAGVSLVRVLNNQTAKEFDPILMLDSFDSVNYDEYKAGFPMHPHRGIETISYISQGKMRHKDNLGNEAEIGDGEVQWMTAGSGILHEELLPKSERLLGVQLWLNICAKNKMCKPSYISLARENIKEITFNGGKLRLLAGDYEGTQGYVGTQLPLDYYDIHLDQNVSFTLKTKFDASVMLFTLVGDVFVGDELISEKTAVKLGYGDEVRLKAYDKKSQVLFISSIRVDEPIAWAGPIVMNTNAEIITAFSELQNGSFIKEILDY